MGTEPADPTGIPPRACATCGGSGKELIDCDGSAGYRPCPEGCPWEPRERPLAMSAPAAIAPPTTVTAVGADLPTLDLGEVRWRITDALVEVRLLRADRTIATVSADHVHPQGKARAAEHCLAGIRAWLHSLGILANHAADQIDAMAVMAARSSARVELYTPIDLTTVQTPRADLWSMQPGVMWRLSPARSWAGIDLVTPGARDTWLWSSPEALWSDDEGILATQRFLRDAMRLWVDTFAQEAATAAEATMRALLREQGCA